VTDGGERERDCHGYAKRWVLMALVALGSPVMMQRVLVDVSAGVGERDGVGEWVSELVCHTYSSFLVVFSGNTVFP